MPFYAVQVGRTPGVYETWAECLEQVKKYKGAVFKKFAHRDLAEAFVQNAPAKDNGIDVYTDGSCDGKKAGAGVFFGDGDPRNASVAVPGEQTNNRAELWAIFVALTLKKDDLVIGTDSQYAMNVLTQVYEAHTNLDLVEQIWKAMKGRNVQFQYVKAHAGIHGNEMADRLAKKFIE